MLNRLSAFVHRVFSRGSSRPDAPPVVEPTHPSGWAGGKKVPAVESVGDPQNTPKAAPRIQVSVSSAPGPTPGEVPTPPLSQSHPSALPEPDAKPAESASEQPELVALTDLSNVHYPTLGGAFAPPPGGQAEERAAVRRHWKTKRSGAHLAVVTEIVDDLARRGASAIAVHADEPIDVLWPTAGAPGEYLVPEIDPAYVITQGAHSGLVRTLGRALPGGTSEGEPRVDDFDRLELVRLAALLIASLHERDLVTAGITWDTFAYSVDPRPSVVLHRPEHVRRIGGEFLQPPTEQGLTGWSSSPFDSDRGDFAVLAFRLLLALEEDADLQPQAAETIAGTSPEQAAALVRLWDRAAGPAGRRPQLVEWLEAFGMGVRA